MTTAAEFGGVIFSLCM